MKIRSVVQLFSKVTLAALPITVMTVAVTFATEHRRVERGRVFVAELSGFEEVHFSAGPPAALIGAISTQGSGKFTAKLDKLADLIEYELSYQDLEGNATQAHIHFGQRSTVGGVVVWLCQTEANPAPEPVAGVTPPCPEREGTVTGTITPDQVLALAAQGFVAGDFDELVRALRAGVTYANVHSELHPPGEIRGQIEQLERRRRR